MKHGSLFSGIGGFDLAAEWMGWTNVFHCEWMEFPRKVLDYHFPNADSHIDICKTDFKKYANKIDILTGGFPCQPFSLAGKRKGQDDERYLWGEMLRAIQEIKPKFVIAENVFGITSIDGGLVFQQVCIDLETEGYEVQPFIIPAAAKNAPHRRDRCWFIASNSKGKGGSGLFIRKKKAHSINGINGSIGDASDSNGTNNKTRTHGQILEQPNRQKADGHSNVERPNQWQNFPTQSPICSGDDGIPTELDGITFSKWRSESIKGYGNAIVPQIAYQLFEIIQELNENN
jgi:DNA (cytosine-5)-methyltransferase 1